MFRAAVLVFLVFMSGLSAEAQRRDPFERFLDDTERTLDDLGGNQRGGGRDYEAGPIWSQADAQNKCPQVCASVGQRWSGHWRTTQQGRMSVCNCGGQPPVARPQPQPRPLAGQGGGQWVYCAPHEGYCRVPYPTTVRYGAQGAFASQQVSGGIQCNQNVFGDPIRGVAKACFYLARGAAQPQPQPGGGWRPCAADFQFCEFSGTATVRYGANGIFTERRATNGIMCEPGSFGRDPVPNVRKQCFVRY